MFRIVYNSLKRLIPARARQRVRSIWEKGHAYYEIADRETFFRKAFTALSFNGISGDYVEFGCHGCRTFKLAYSESRKYSHNCKLWAFDSFQGLPPPAGAEDAHPAWIAGNLRTSLTEFVQACQRHKIPESKFHIVEGFYEQTLRDDGGSSARLPTDIAIAYIDCDLYSSTKAVLGFLSTRLKHGMIIAFDDYYCWSSTAIAGERKAWLEMTSQDDRFHFLPYFQIGWSGMSFVVEDRTLLGEYSIGSSVSF